MNDVDVLGMALQITQKAASVRRVFESRYGGPPQQRGSYRRPPYSPPPGRGLEDDYE